MTLHRFVLPADALVYTSGETREKVTFGGDQARQIRKVLRLREGDRVLALDGAGSEYVVRLRAVSERQTTGLVEERRPSAREPSVPIWLYLGVLKGAKFELVLQKCTEIGVRGFVPVVTARSVSAEPGSSRQRRFETIVREAVEQSRRGMLPIVSQPVSYPEAVRQARAKGTSILLWEAERSLGLPEVIRDVPNGSVCLLVGPEGGFTEDEVARAQDAGVRVAGLGPRILRSETAAIAASALVLAHFGDLG
jgi:16S rRNA (uracil1498-N3)-methyltransferase